MPVEEFKHVCDWVALALLPADICWGLCVEF
jgi:hypothetical protein